MRRSASGRPQSWFCAGWRRGSRPAASGVARSSSWPSMRRKDGAVSTRVGCRSESRSARSPVPAAPLDQASVETWGWRIPFLVGFLLLPIGYYLRTHVAETPAFERVVESRKVARAPIRDAFASQKRMMALVCGTSVIWNAGGYVLLVYLPVFANQVLKVDLSLALAAAAIGSVVRAILTPPVGILGDRIGRKTVIQAMNVGFLVLVYPMFLWMKTDPG